MRVLTLVSADQEPLDPEELRRCEARDEHPRASVYQDTLNSDLLDERFLSKAPALRRGLYKWIPTYVAQVIEAYFVRKRYDAIVTWSDKIGLALAMVFKITRARVPHITLSSWISKPKKAIPLKLFHSHIDRIVLWSSVQREYALNSLHLPESKIAFTRWLVDQKFWRSLEVETDMISSVGRHMRDYPTLVESLRGLDIRCHIANGGTKGQMFSTLEEPDDMDVLPENITTGALDPVELRKLYARSRFVVVPLLPTDTDNGVAVTLEAMAMGKAVICSHVAGQIDVIQAGKTGIYVPQGDPAALRNAIEFLWNHPEEAARMGQAAREYVEKFHTIDQFVNTIKGVVEDVVAERSSAKDKAKSNASQSVLVDNASLTDR